MSEREESSELARYISWRLPGLQGSTSLWWALDSDPGIIDATEGIPLKRINHTRNRFIACLPPGSPLGALILHFDDFHGILRPVKGGYGDPAPTDVFFTFLPAGSTGAAAAGMTCGETYSTPSPLRISYSDCAGRNRYGEPLGRIRISGPENGEYALVDPYHSHIATPSRDRKSPRRPLNEIAELTGPGGNGPWASRFEIRADTVGFLLHQGPAPLPFLIPRSITVRAP